MLRDNHELIQPFYTFFNNVTQSKFIERISPYNLCDGIAIPGARKEINFIKHIVPKVFKGKLMQI